MEGVVLETLSNRKLIVFGVVLLLVQIGFFLIGGLVGESIAFITGAPLRTRRVSLKHDGTDGPVKLVNTDGTAIERADGTANTGANYQIITY